jgi:hypothetical protein
MDLKVLTEVVRQDQRDPQFKIIEWSVRPLNDRGMVNPEGLWLISGHGEVNGVSQPWSIVLKMLDRPDTENPPDARMYWKREYHIAQSGLGERFGSSIRSPHVYRADDASNQVWLWIEHIQDKRPGKWTLAEFEFAARRLGRWNGENIQRPLIETPWLVKNLHRAWEKVINLENDWDSPLHHKYISPGARQRMEQVWMNRGKYYSCLEQLPQCFTHFDCQRRNLFIQTPDLDGDEPMIVLDWALCGIGALGAELQALVGGSTTFVEWPASDLAVLDSAAFKSYLQGLHDSGWDGDPDLVRLGFVSMLAIYRAPILPLAMGKWFCTPQTQERDLRQFGIANDDLYLHYKGMMLYWLDCADEARILMGRLDLL